MRQSLFALFIVAIVKVKVLRIDLKRKRISLSINRTRREGATQLLNVISPLKKNRTKNN